MSRQSSLKIYKHRRIDSSWGSIFRIAVPTIFSYLSGNMMFFIGRLMLARYSVDAMSAALIAGSFVSVITWIFAAVAGMGEVLVGRFNGAKEYEKLAGPVWQMFYLGIASCVVFVPLAIFSEQINLFPKYYLADGIAYQKPLLYFGCLQTFLYAIYAFFIGQGKARIVTFAVIIGNVSNAFLTYIFVFWLDMGASGAAFGTVISQFIQLFALGSVFFNSRNRRVYKTLENRKFDKAMFKECIRFGVPSSAGHFFSTLAWYLLQVIVSHTSKQLGTIYGICINVFVLCFFGAEGLSSAITSIASNMIGQKDFKSVSETYKKFIHISAVVGFITSVPLLFFPKVIFDLFGIIEDGVYGLCIEIKIVFRYIAIDIILSNFLLVTSGVLLAGKDSKYTVFVNQTCLWALAVVPVYILSCMGSLDSTITVFKCVIAWQIVSLLLMYLRYRSPHWQKL
jgi:MATE family multidrug resistance protein